MFRTASLAALLGSVIALPLVAQDLAPVKDIDVETELSAINNAEAATYWGTLDTDLEGALAAELAPRLGEEGLDINIDISEVELANFFTAGIGAEETMLKGDVRVVSDNGAYPSKNFELTVTMGQTLPLLPAGTDLTIITPTSAEVYAGLVANFAKAVAERIDG